MTTIEKIVAGAFRSKLITDKGRRILVTGLTHLVISDALKVQPDYQELNARVRVVHNPHTFILCPLLVRFLRRSLCMSPEVLRGMPQDRLTHWLVHYTPPWLRYTGDYYSMYDDIRAAVSATLAVRH